MIDPSLTAEDPRDSQSPLRHLCQAVRAAPLWPAWTLPGAVVLAELALGHGTLPRGAVARLIPLAAAATAVAWDRLARAGRWPRWARRSLVASDAPRVFRTAGGVALQYRLVEGVALVEGLPDSDAQALHTTVAAFLVYCHTHGYPAALAHVPADHLPLYRRMGFQSLPLGRAPVVDLAALPTRRGVTTGDRCVVYRHGLRGPLVEAAAALCRQNAAPRRPRTDSLLPLLRHGPVVARHDDAGRLVGVTAWRDLGGRALALALWADHDDSLADGATDALLYGSLDTLRQAGYTVASLGLTPVSAAHNEPWVASATQALYVTPPAAAAMLQTVARWEERHLLYTHAALLPAALHALRRATWPAGLLPVPVALPLAAQQVRAAGHPATPQPLYRRPNGNHP